jgi:uncharacterized membrane protein
MRSEGDEARIDAAADLIAQTVPSDPAKLLDRLNATEPTGMQLSPDKALDLVTPMVVDNPGERAEIYLLSDLRRNEFGEPATLRNKLKTLAENSATLHVVDCAQETGPNMSLANVEPMQEVWAAGVPLMIRFQVRNQSNQPQRNVVVKVKAVSYVEGLAVPQVDRPFSGDAVDLPPIVIEQIDAGETVTRQVQVAFNAPGEHVVEVSLPEDSVATDNRRWCVIGIRESQRILAIDGALDQSNAFYLETVISPDARLRTGMTLEKFDSSYLRDVSQEALNQFDVVVLLDVPRLEAVAVAKLESFCRQGGGVWFACGPNTNLQFTNEQLYRGGEGVFPLELASIRENPEAIDSSQPQVVALEHPILKPLTQLTGSPFFLLRIRQQIVPTRESAEAPSLEVIARGSDNLPLMVDKSFGDGHAVALLTGLTPAWSNWAQDPTFVVLALRSLGYLGSFRRAATSQLVGEPLEMVSTSDTILPDGEILLPSRDGAMRVRLQRPVESDAKDSTVSKLALPIELGGMDRDLIDALLRPGIYEMWVINSKGEFVYQNRAHNVLAAEGNLDRVSHVELDEKLAGVPLDIRSAESVSGSGLNSPEAAHSTLLMALLAGLLLIEQLLAYSASYHTPTPVATRVAGGLR